MEKAGRKREKTVDKNKYNISQILTIKKQHVIKCRKSRKWRKYRILSKKRFVGYFCMDKKSIVKIHKKKLENSK